jgi:hypothetical protein
MPFRGVGRVPARIRDTLAEAASRAWNDLVDMCIAREVEFVVVVGGDEAGDDDDLNSRLRLRSGLKRLAEHGIRCFLTIDGDDCRLSEMLPDSSPKRVTVFPSDAPQSFVVEHRDRPVAVVCGQSRAPAGTIDYGRFFAGAPTDLPRIGVVPGALADLEGALAADGPKASYWALGDHPEPSRRGFSPWIVEAGSLQGRAPIAGERGTHGAMFVEVEGGRVLAVDHVAADRVRYAQLELTPKFTTDEALLSHQIMDALNRLRATHAGRALLVDIVFEPAANGSLPAFSRADAASLLSRLRVETESWDPFVWCSNLDVARHDPVEPTGDAVAQAIVQESRALLGNPLQRSYSFARRFDPLMRRWTSELDTVQAEKLINDAAALALNSIAADQVAGD